MLYQLQFTIKSKVRIKSYSAPPLSHFETQWEIYFLSPQHLFLTPHPALNIDQLIPLLFELPIIKRAEFSHFPQLTVFIGITSYFCLSFFCSRAGWFRPRFPLLYHLRLPRPSLCRPCVCPWLCHASIVCFAQALTFSEFYRRHYYPGQACCWPAVDHCWC